MRKNNNSEGMLQILIPQVWRVVLVFPNSILVSIIIQPPGWRFFLSPAFPETQVFIYFGLNYKMEVKTWREIAKHKTDIGLKMN